MIESLQKVFEGKSSLTKLYMRKKLLTLKYKNTEGLTAHFSKFDTIINELESSGSRMEESDKVCHLLLTMN